MPSGMRWIVVLLLSCGVWACLGCRHMASLSGSWGIPGQEGDGEALSREVILIADNQIQHLYGDPVWLRSGFTNRFVSVAIRAVQLDFYAPDILRWIVENYGDRRVLIHLGDALNMACSAEWEVFVDVMGANGRGWVLAPGNHDAFYFGNGDFSRDEWKAACATGDGRGTPFTKERFVRAYLAALASQKQHGVPGFHFELPDPLPNEGTWEVPSGNGALLTGVAWKIDDRHPWRSFVVQRLDLRLPGAVDPVTAIMTDTTQYAFRPGLLPIYPWRNAGVTGNLGGDQIAIVSRWLGEERPQVMKLVMGHHPYDALAGRARDALDRWRARDGVDLYVSAHTHTAQYFVHGGQEDAWLELNLGSTTDWPPEFRTLAVSTDTRYEDQLAVRLQRYPVHRVWEKEQILDCRPEWEVPPERKDFYLAYDELLTPNPLETQKALMDILLRSHEWLLRFVPSSSINTAWPSASSSDAEVAQAIHAALASHDVEEKLSLLRELRQFERERKVASFEVQREFHLCQAQWASKYDLRGRRAPDVDDAYILIPKE